MYAFKVALTFCVQDFINSLSHHHFDFSRLPWFPYIGLPHIGIRFFYLRHLPLQIRHLLQILTVYRVRPFFMVALIVSNKLCLPDLMRYAAQVFSM